MMQRSTRRMFGIGVAATTLVVFSSDLVFPLPKLLGRQSVEPAGQLVRPNLQDHFRQAALGSNRCCGSDRHSDGTGREPRLVRQSQLTVGV